MDIEIIIVIGVVLLFVGFMIYQQQQDKKDSGGSSGSSGIGGSPPSFLKIISPHYGLYARDYIPFLDMLKEYNINACRIFAYGGGGWGDFPFKPWTGNNMGDISSERMNKMNEFVKEANKRGIWVIVSLTHNNSGGYTEDITSRGKGEISTYLSKVVTELRYYGVIFETANEIDDKGFQEYVRDRIKEYGGRYTCSYNHHLGCNYRNVHTKNKSYIGGNAIHSNDKDFYTNYYTNGDYINIARQAKEQGGHFEFLMFWSRKGELNTPDEIRRDYGDVLEVIKGL